MTEEILNLISNRLNKENFTEQVKFNISFKLGEIAAKNNITSIFLLQEELEKLIEDNYTNNYRPYNSAKEFIDAQEIHGEWIFAGDEAEFPVCATDLRVMLHVMEPGQLSQHSYVNYKELLKNYVWKDGTPCGIKVN